MAATETSTRAAAALDDLYRHHVGEVYRYTYAVLGNHSDAEDVTQTTFVNALRALERGEDPRNASAWLIAIAQNVVRQRWRQAAARPAEVELERDVPVVDGEEDIEIDELVRALQRIPPSQREALVMRELEGRPYNEIAELLGLTTAALETLLFRARRSLAEELENLVTCQSAQLALSKQLDGRLGRKERRRLDDHLAECQDCARLAEMQKRQRRAFKGLAIIPIPVGLALFKGAPSASAASSLPHIGLASTGTGANGAGGAAGAAGAGAAGGAATGTGGAAVGGSLVAAALKVAAVIVTATVATGVAYKGVQGLDDGSGSPAAAGPEAQHAAQPVKRGGVPSSVAGGATSPKGAVIAGVAAGSSAEGSSDHGQSAVLDAHASAPGAPDAHDTSSPGDAGTSGSAAPPPSSGSGDQAASPPTGPTGPPASAARRRRTRLHRAPRLPRHSLVTPTARRRPQVPRRRPTRDSPAAQAHRLRAVLPPAARQAVRDRPAAQERVTRAARSATPVPADRPVRRAPTGPREAPATRVPAGPRAALATRAPADRPATRAERARAGTATPVRAARARATARGTARAAASATATGRATATEPPVAARASLTTAATVETARPQPARATAPPEASAQSAETAAPEAPRIPVTADRRRSRRKRRRRRQRRRRRRRGRPGRQRDGRRRRDRRRRRHSR